MFRAIFMLATAVVLSGCAATQETKVRGCYHANEAVERDIGFCQAIRVGDTLYVSGNVGAGNMPDAIRTAYETVKKTLAANGLDFHNVVKENVYATDLDAFIRYKDVRREYYGTEYPAATWVQVQRLFSPSFVVEVEVVAKFP
jgi:2-iminobutanoate/2-iminopropanoate deaminase